MTRTITVDHNGLEVLNRDECLRLLGGETIGRLAITSQALPVILPVNFLLDGERVLIRTTPGTKLHAAAAGAVVAFEVDRIDRFSHTGWSVSITGVARVIHDAGELDRIGRLPLPRWAPTRGDESVIAISSDVMSGRRIPYGSRHTG